MSIVGLVIALVLFLLLLGIILIPFLQTSRASADNFRNKQRERALAYYERVLKNIRDLDDDQVTGKISQEEFEIERKLWLNRGVQLLKMLDELDASQNIIDNTEADDAAIDEAIEKAISASRTQA